MERRENRLKDDIQTKSEQIQQMADKILVSRNQRCKVRGLTGKGARRLARYPVGVSPCRWMEKGGVRESHLWRGADEPGLDILALVTSHCSLYCSLVCSHPTSFKKKKKEMEPGLCHMTYSHTLLSAEFCLAVNLAKWVQRATGALNRYGPNSDSLLERKEMSHAGWFPQSK